MAVQNFKITAKNEQEEENPNEDVRDSQTQDRRKSYTKTRMC